MNGTGLQFDELRQRLAAERPIGRCDEASVRRLWWAALETLQQDLLIPEDVRNGLWLAAPLPALYEPQLLGCLHGWVWAPEDLEQLVPSSAALPGTGTAMGHPTGHNYRRLALHPDDCRDPLLILITPKLQLALALQGSEGKRQLLMSSDPTTLGDSLALIGRQLQDQAPDMAEHLQDDLRRLGPLHTDETLQQRFWPQLAERLTTMAPSITLQTPASTTQRDSDPQDDLGLLEALSHEVRTPLATIRTLIRSLIRRRDLPAVVMKRLRQIDVECSEQIDRFGLIFHAAELQRQPQPSNLARTDLAQILESLEPAWTNQLERRGIQLRLDLEAGLPLVLSDPGRLEPMLGGLIDRASRGLPSGSGLRLLLGAAGARLKLQILVHPSSRETGPCETTEQASPQTATSKKADVDTAKVGAVLSWDPTTGSLQLSQQATRQLLASLGGRYRQREDRNLTVFFPVASETG